MKLVIILMICHKKWSRPNIIVSRSGSSTINEIITAQKPSVLIPFPYAVDDHQLYNAKILKSLSCSEIISNNRLNSQYIIKLSVKNL